MSKILCIGIVTLDIINEVADYPTEDSEVRIISQQQRRGGNAGNTAVLLSQLGHQCSWAGTFLSAQAEDIDCRFILSDLDKYRIKYNHCQLLSQGKIPTSYITLSKKTGSRTIIHYRDLAEFSFPAFKKIELKVFDWIHFEGRNIKHTYNMMRQSKIDFPTLTVSLEIEKPREGIEDLIQFADIIIFSRHYVLEQGFSSAKDFFQSKEKCFHNKSIFCAWGSAGAAAYSQHNYYWQDALDVDVIDTIAAGDVFNAAIIDQQIKQQSIEASLIFACQTAAHSCRKKGIAF